MKVLASSRRQKTFKVMCSSFGGRPLSMSLTGPSGVQQDITHTITEVGEITRTGNDSFSAEISVKRGGDGDTYNCTASNIASNSSNKLILRGVITLFYFHKLIIFICKSSL